MSYKSRDIAAALQSFFTSLGLTSYLSGEAPLSASAPYVTYTVTASAPNGLAYIYATAWVKATAGTNWQYARLTMADTILEGIGKAGAHLTLAHGGYIRLYEADDALAYIDDKDEDLKGVRINVEAHFYV